MNKHLALLILISQSIFAQTLSISYNEAVICKSKVGEIGFTPSGVFNVNNYFTIQLSDSSGSFTNPLSLSRFSNASFQNIAFVVPDTLYLGTKYRIRAVSSNPVIVSADNGNNLAVVDTCKIPIKPIITLQNLSSNLICTPAAATISWSITGGTFSSTNSLTIQLSDSSGSFHSPLNLAVASANATTQNIVIPDGFLEGTKYKFRVIATDSSRISNNSATISIRNKPKPVIDIVPRNACLGDTVRLIAKDSSSINSTFLWSGNGKGTNDTLTIIKAGIANEGNYTVSATLNACSVSTSKQLLLSNCKPEWAWALADTFWTNTLNSPSTIVDSELDANNNLYVVGFFSEKMKLGANTIKAIEGNSAFCENEERKTGFLAKLNSNGQLLWHRKWNSVAVSDYQYCDLTIDNGKVFIVSEFNADSPCSTTPRNQANLVITDEEDFSLGNIIGYCRYPISGTIPTQYEYRYKGRFAWAARFDLYGNLDALSNLTELKSCSSSATNFDTQPSFGLGNKGYYSLKARNNKLWLLYTWNQGLPNPIKFSNGNLSTNEAAGLVIAELNPSNLSIIRFEKMAINSPSGALGLANLDIDTQNNVIITGSNATTSIGSALQIIFGTTQLNFTDADYFLAKYNTTSSTWTWSKKSQIEQQNTFSSAAPNLKIDSQNNIYLAFSFKPLNGGNFAGLTFPATPTGFDVNKTAALMQVNSNGIAQWIKLNNHQMQEGRNMLGVDSEDNIYFTTFLKNSPTNENFLINNHRLEYKSLKNFVNNSGTPMVAIYTKSGKLTGTVNNIKVENTLSFNGLVIDNQKNIIFSGQNIGKTNFGQFELKTNFGNQSNNLDDRKRAFVLKIDNPISTNLDSVSNHVCTGSPTEIRFYTTGVFSNNNNFKVQLIGIDGTLKDKILEIASGSSSPISFVAPDSLAENSFYVRVITSDNKIVGSYRTDNTLTINSVPEPVILSNLIGYSLNQKLCTNRLNNYRIQGWGGTEGILKYNGTMVYTGSNIDYQPTLEQSGIYTVHWTRNGCSGVSPSLKLEIYQSLTAQLSGSQIVSIAGTPILLSLTVNGGKEYEANISGLAPFTSDKTSQIITVNPTQTTSYTLTSVTNTCGNAVVSGIANIVFCLNSMVLKNPDDNIVGGTILKETSKEFGKITADNHLSNKAKVVYSSGKSILLNPGFLTADSVSFKAEIGGCNATTASSDPNFKLGFQKLFINNSNADQTIVEMTEFANKGAKLFEMTIRLEQVFKSLSQFNETNPATLNQYWALFDRIIGHANNIYDHVVFRIAVDYDDTRYYFQERDENMPNQQVYTTFGNALFDLFGGEIIQDQFGNPARVAYGSGHGSFASMTAKAKMKGFVQKIMDRYYPILGQKLYWVAVVTSAQFETGFNYENSWNGTNFGNPHACEYDYTFANVNQFRTWLITERYVGLAGLNAAYGTNYANPSQIQAPKVNVTTLDNMTNAGLQAMYNSQLFADWYKFNYKQMKSFLLECKDVVKTANSNIKFCFEAGSNTDQLSAARKTFDIPDINTYADVLKTAFQTSTFSGSKTWDADVVRSNFTGEIESEINEADPVNLAGITDPTLVKQKMLEYSKIAYLNKARAVIFVADKTTQYYNNSLDALAEFKTWIDSHTEQFTEGQTINVNLTDLIKNFSAAVLPFNSITPSLPVNGYQNRPKIIINSNN